MKFNLNPGLLVYIIASIVSLIVKALGYENAFFLLKPIIVPAIYFYYLQIENYSPKFWFSIVILLSYISDMIVLFYFTNDEVPIAILNMAIYIILIFYFLKQANVKSFKGIKIIVFLISSVTLIFIANIVLSLMESLDDTKFTMYIFYGVILSMLTSIAIFNHLNSSNYSSFYGLMICICCIFTDIFFVIYNFYMRLEIFILINLAAQFISYYYMVNFITTNEQRNAISNQ